MVIRVDAEGNKAIQQLCDVALRTGGMNNFGGVVQILNAVLVEGNDGTPGNVDDPGRPGPAGGTEVSGGELPNGRDSVSAGQ
jgi:hypothetical protein